MKRVVLVLLVAGCGGVATQSTLKTDGADARQATAEVGHEVLVERVGTDAGAPVHDAGALGADGDDAIDAVPADADGRDGLAEIAEARPETAPEAPAQDVISGMWHFNFTPNRGRGEMTLKLSAGGFVTGTYAAMGIPPNDSPGNGAVSGSYDGATLTLAFTGAISANASGPVESDGGSVRVPDGKGHALIGTETVGFMANAH